MFLERPKEKEPSKVQQKKITLRVPDRLWVSIQEKANKEYSGRGKQSKLVNEALEHFFKSSSVDSINWGNTADDYVLINLLTQIKLGANMKNIGKNPVQANIDMHLLQKMVDLELNIKGLRKMLDVHIKPAIIRMALSQWMYADRRFLQDSTGN